MVDLFIGKEATYLIFHTDSVQEMGGTVWFGLADATDLWQPVDAGYAATLKMLVAKTHQEWLDDDSYADRWFNNVQPYSATERRVLITHWVGNAWKMLNQPKYDKLRNACWTATGCLLTADGSDDHLVKPEGLPEFQVPPPTSQIHDAEPKSNIYEVSPFDGETESEMDMLVGFDPDDEIDIEETDEIDIENNFGIIDQILLKQ